jgi:hypothetical protein
VRYHTYGAHLPEIGVSEFTHGLEHELDDASDPGTALTSFSAHQSCYLSDTKHLMCHGLPYTIRECPVIGRRGFDRWAGQRRLMIKTKPPGQYSHGGFAVKKVAGIVRQQS